MPKGPRSIPTRTLASTNSRTRASGGRRDSPTGAWEERKTQPSSASSLPLSHPVPQFPHLCRAGGLCGPTLTNRAKHENKEPWMEVGASQAAAGPRARGHPLDSMGKQMGTVKWAAWHRPARRGWAGWHQAGQPHGQPGRWGAVGRMGAWGAQASSPARPLHPPLLGLSLQE